MPISPTSSILPLDKPALINLLLLLLLPLLLARQVMIEAMERHTAAAPHALPDLGGEMASPSSVLHTGMLGMRYVLSPATPTESTASHARIDLAIEVGVLRAVAAACRAVPQRDAMGNDLDLEGEIFALLKLIGARHARLESAMSASDKETVVVINKFMREYDGAQDADDRKDEL
jgi:hypothetical protein